ncbi:2OG-Fe(II) oxygenase [Nocardia noduli]|uniref:2OG-Fe(II) oxygenase n=1 Tax=Nocardia noduli TaxID=2815722 RepID=UPI0027E0676F|nr:2OG-Fe(II) oxygenase [Nocardia noduli]
MTGVMTSRAQTPPAWFTELFAHRRWIRRTGPFPHIYARDIFVADFYQRLVDDYARVRAERIDRFHRVTGHGDATALGLSELRDGPLALFATREWHDLIAGVTGVAATGDIDGSVRHHAPGSPAGTPDNGLAPVLFAEPPPGPAEVRLPGEAGTRETVRAVAVLFHLGNPDWRTGDGGEITLRADSGGDSTAPALTIPPLDNSMVIFECTPRSWHHFAGGNTADRGSVVMWLHRPRHEAESRWGAGRLDQR